MESRERIDAAIRSLLESPPGERITLASVADAAGLSAQTVRRLLGGKDGLKGAVALVDSARMDGQDTRTRIVAAAQAEFARLGFHGATLDQIAASAGLTKGAIYWHFTSKESLFLALLREAHARYLPQLEEFAQGELRAAEDPDKAFESWLRDQIAAQVQNPQWERLFWEFFAETRAPEVRKEFLEIWQAFTATVVRLAQNLQTAGVIAADVDPVVLASFVDAFLNGLSMQVLINPSGMTPERWASQITRVLWGGLTP